MSFEFLAKVVASGAALFPLIFLYDDALVRYKGQDRKDIVEMLENPYIVGTFAFGISLAATGDTKATMTALVVIACMYMLHESESDAEEEDE